MLDQIIYQLQTYARAIPGILNAPANVPEASSQFPFAIAYPSEGTINLETGGTGKDIDTVYWEFHFSRVILPSAIEKALPYKEIIRDILLANPTLNSTVDTIVYPVKWEFGRLSFMGAETLGYRFTITMKVRH